MKNIHDDLPSLDLGIYEARDLAQNRPLWRLMSAQCYVLVVVHATIGLISVHQYFCLIILFQQPKNLTYQLPHALINCTVYEQLNIY